MIGMTDDLGEGVELLAARVAEDVPIDLGCLDD